MQTQRRGIETPYAGHVFRSRLEARWAAFFDLMGWRWTYEPIDLDGYIPDFILDFKAPLLVEVKPAIVLPDLEEYTAKIDASGWRGEALLVGSSPLLWNEGSAYGKWGEEFLSAFDKDGPYAAAPRGYVLGLLGEDGYAGQGEDHEFDPSCANCCSSRWWQPGMWIHDKADGVGISVPHGKWFDRITGDETGGHLWPVGERPVHAIAERWGRAHTLTRWVPNGARS